MDIWGGLGDVVLATPVFERLKNKSPRSRIIALSNSKDRLEVLRHNPYIDKLTSFSYYHRLLKFLGIISIQDIRYGFLKPSLSYTKKASEIIAGMLGVTLKDKTAQIYLTEEEEEKAVRKLSDFKHPVIIQITSRTTENQMWPIASWNELVRELPDYTFLQLGAKDEEKVEGAVDMRGNTNIRESLALMKHAKGFVGVVSFLSHVTNAFDKPGVVFFGVSSVAIWGHDNNINISKDLPCSPCVDVLGRSKCPYGKECMRLISVNEVRKAIYEQMPLNIH